MSNDVWKKKLGFLLRAGLALSLVLLGLALWRYSVDYAKRIHYSGDIVQYRSAKELSIADYDRMVQKEKRAAAPKDFVLWDQRSGETLENPLANRQVETTVLRYVGNVQLLLPDCWQLDAGDAKGCVLGKSTALELLGDAHAQGAELILDEQRYIVRAVESSPSDMMILLASEDDPLTRIQMRGKADAEAFAMRHGLALSPVQISYFENLSGLICYVPLFCLLGIAFYWLLKLKKSQAAYPVRYTVLLFLCFAFATGSAMCLLRLIPPDYIPSRWSDFEHFTELGSQIKAQSIAFFVAEKTLPDLQIAALFGGACGAGLLAAILLLFAYARLLDLIRLSGDPERSIL